MRPVATAYFNVPKDVNDYFNMVPSQSGLSRPDQSDMS